MEKIIKTVYTSLYQRTTGISYREKVLVTITTIGFMLAIIIPLLASLFLD
jgi:hypothetical protein